MLTPITTTTTTTASRWLAVRRLLPSARAFSSAAPRRSVQPPHNDIESFLAYAESAELRPETSVYVGTLFEYVWQCCSLGGP